MSIRVNKKDIVDYCILWLLILHVMIIRWLNLTGEFNQILLMLFLYRIFKNIFGFIKSYGIIWLGLIFFYAIYNYVTHGGEFYTLIKNMYEILVPALELIYITYLMRYKKECLFRFFYILFWPLVVYNFLNILFMFLQLSGEYWLAGFTSHTNDTKVDLISGLLGFNGVPMLTLFSAFMIIYNYFYLQYYTIKYKKLLCGYNILLIIIYSVLSMLNDNKGFYLVMVMYILIYIFILNESKTLKKGIFKKFWNFIIWIIPFAIIIILAFVIMYRISFFKTYIDKLLHELNSGITYMNNYQGSSERFGMIAYSLSHKKQCLTGFGIGKYTWTTPNAFGFIHYGQSDAGTFMCLGGIMFVVLFGALIYSAFNNIFYKSISSLILLLMYTILAVYTQVFTVTSLMVSSLFFIVVCWMAMESRMNGNLLYWKNKK